MSELDLALLPMQQYKKFEVPSLNLSKVIEEQKLKEVNDLFVTLKIGQGHPCQNLI
jgi:hypothetical protein